MAISPKDKYLTRVIDGNTAMPYGQALDQQGGVEGSGTPLQADWVNDLWGLEQALLTQSGITPSGDTDTADRSDYLDTILIFLAKKCGLNYVGRFAEGLTYSDDRDFGLTSDYKVYKYAGANPYPIIVTPSTDPSVNSDFKEIFLNEAVNLYKESGENLEDFLSNLSVSDINGLQTALDSKEDDLGFTPVQQGTGSNQNNDAIRMGWSTLGEDKIRVEVDSVDFGTRWPIDVKDSETLNGKPTATTAEAISGTSDKLPDTIGVKAAIEELSTKKYEGCTVFNESSANGGDELYILQNPNGATYSTATSEPTGAIEISLPIPSDTNIGVMMHFKVDVFSHTDNDSMTFIIGAYCRYPLKDWEKTSAVQIGGVAEYPVRFAFDGATPKIVIGDVTDVFGFSKVKVSDFMGGSQGVFSDFTDGWSVDLVTTLPTSIYSTISDKVITTATEITAQNVSGATVLSNGVTSGANLSPTKTGTWRNISGNDILNNGYGRWEIVT